MEDNEKKKILFASFLTNTGTTTENPWSPEDVDKFEYQKYTEKEYNKIVDDCRFFYKKEPICATTINKLVDIGITELVFTQGTLSANEVRIFQGIKDKLQEFSENMALEFLVSGLVIPEIRYGMVGRNYLSEHNIKKYESLILPVSMWMRDPSTIKINSSIIADSPSYYLKVPDNLVYFIMHDGVYQDGTKDYQKYNEFLAYYPDFVAAIKAGQREILLDNDLIFRRKYLSNSPYPIPYPYAAIEPMRHKRNLRRMDYAIAARVIGAIQLVRLGNDEYPLTEDDQEQFDSIKQQMYWRNSGDRDIERIFQLFGNHTLDVTWVFPPTEALLDDRKYGNINNDIIMALGMPRTLLIGEAEKSNAGSSEYVSLSPVKTMESMRRKILVVINNIVNNIAKYNNLKYTPIAKFKPLRLEDFSAFSTAIYNLYTTGNLSRTSYAETLGFEFEDEVNRKAEENEMIEELGVEVFAPAPYSPSPNSEGNNLNNTMEKERSKNNNSDKNSDKDTD